MTKIDLVVTDLDSTLWERADDLHPATRAAIGELETRGYPLLVATGRRLASTRDPLLQLGLTPPAVVLNGALVVNLATGERIFRRPYDENSARAVLDAFLAAGVEPCVYVEHDEADVFVSDNPTTHPEHLAQFGQWAKVGDLAEVVAQFPVLSFGVIGVPPSEVEGLEDTLVGVANAHVAPERIYGGGGLTVTVAPLGQSKWDGVEAFCQHRGLDSAKVLAIGDGPNDLELLENASIALAPKDSHPEALARADHVVAPAGDGGWAELVDLLP